MPAPGLHAATGFGRSYIQLAHQLAAPAWLAAALATAPLGRPRRAALAAGAGLAMAATALTSSRAAWAGLAVGAVVLAALLGGRWLRRGLPLAAVAVLAAALAAPGLRARLGNALSPGVNDDRGMIWAVCKAAWREHPLGVGPANAAREADRWFDALAPQAEIRTGCHSMPLQLLLEGGPLLLAAWAGAALWVAAALLRARRERGRAGDTLGRAAAAGALAGLAAWGVNGLVNDLHRESRAGWGLALTLAVAAVLAWPERSAARRLSAGRWGSRRP
ncbi:MAG: O-antigen ligase family protein [Anaeromyxobacter sp.]